MLNNKRTLYKLIDKDNTKTLYKFNVIKEEGDVIYFKKHLRSKIVYIINKNDLNTIFCITVNSLDDTKTIYSLNKNNCFNKHLKVKYIPF